MTERSPSRRSRRRWLAACAGVSAGLTGFAGCTGSDDSDGETDSDANGSDGNGTEPESDTADDGTGSGTDEPEPADSWPMYGYDAANTGHVPSTGPKDDVEIKWTYEVEGELRARPVIANGSVYVATKEDSDAKARHLYALDSESGDLEWKHDGGSRHTPVVSEETLFHVNTDDDTVDAFDTADGDKRWSADTRSDTQHVETRPTVVDETVYVVAQKINLNKAVWAIDAESGEVSDVFRDDGAFSNALCVGDGALFTSLDDDVCAIDLETGEERWRVDKSIGAQTSKGANHVFADGVVYVLNGQKDLIALEADSGEERWRIDIASAEAADLFTSGLSIANGLLYVGVEERLWAVDVDEGEPVWETEFEYRVASKPTIADGILYVYSPLAIHAFDAETGDVRWQFEMDDQTSRFGGVIVLDGIAYAVSRDNHVYALEEA